MSFGKIINDHPSGIAENKLKDYLSTYGVLVFRNYELSDLDIYNTMSKLGKVQSSVEQQAPEEYVDPDNNSIIHLSNNDFLGKSRMYWHMDQSYLEREHLPIRSLYCSNTDTLNSTEFADVKFLTDKILQRWPEAINLEAKYYIDRDKTSFVQRKIFSYCSHVNRLLLRYDQRLEIIETINSSEFKEFCTDILNSNEIPKVIVNWKPFDFVIFDNNQSPHRRSEMNGSCNLKRLTSYFWN